MWALKLASERPAAHNQQKLTQVPYPAGGASWLDKFDV